MRGYRTVIPFLKKNWHRYLIGILLLIAVDFADLLVPQIIRRFADLISSGQLNRDRLFQLILQLIALGFMMAGGRFIWRINIFGTARKLEYWLRDKLVKKYLSMDQSFFNNHRTGDLMAHATNDVFSVRNSLGGGVMMITDSIFMTFLSVILMVMTVGIKTAAIALISLPFLVFAISRILTPLQKRSRIVQNTFSDLTTEVQENLSGVRVIKASAIEENRERSFQKVNDLYLEKNMDLLRLDGLFDPLIDLISGISFVVFIFYGSSQVLRGSMTIGSFVAVIEYLYRIIWPLVAMGIVTGSFQRGIASMNRLNEIFYALSKIQEPQDGIQLDKVEGRITFDHVWFRYSDQEDWVLKDVSFELSPGTSLAILGRTGSGKSTIIQLILRRYEVNRGKISLDGVDIRDLSFKSLYTNLSVVFQESFLFSRTIADNIAFSADHAAQDRVVQASEFSQVRSDIERMEEGFRTLVGERGVTLSGGQKQRVAIARAYYEDASVLLLDDALSAVDTETENRILKNLRKRSKSLVLVSQRISTVEGCDQIIVLEEGKISQRGKHADLLQEEGFYKELYEQQLLENRYREVDVEWEKEKENATD